jgi:imidazolonepropionase-like amidohydrolase
VVVEGDRIARVVRGGEPELPRDAERIDCGGRTLMPGLTDAHVHCAIIETEPSKARRDSPATMALRIKDVLEQTLGAGFTTVRDAFGIDWGFAQAIKRGLLRGPRVLFVGPCLSETGGPDDPNVGVLEVTVRSAQYWNIPGGVLGKITAYVKAASGNVSDIAESDTVEFRESAPQ